MYTNLEEGRSASSHAILPLPHSIHTPLVTRTESHDHIDTTPRVSSSYRSNRSNKNSTNSSQLSLNASSENEEVSLIIDDKEKEMNSLDINNNEEWVFEDSFAREKFNPELTNKEFALEFFYEKQYDFWEQHMSMPLDRYILIGWLCVNLIGFSLAIWLVCYFFDNLFFYIFNCVLAIRILSILLCLVGAIFFKTIILNICDYFMITFLIITGIIPGLYALGWIVLFLFSLLFFWIYLKSCEQGECMFYDYFNSEPLQICLYFYIPLIICGIIEIYLIRRMRTHEIQNKKEYKVFMTLANYFTQLNIAYDQYMQEYKEQIKKNALSPVEEN